MVGEVLVRCRIEGCTKFALLETTQRESLRVEEIVADDSGGEWKGGGEQTNGRLIRAHRRGLYTAVTQEKQRLPFRQSKAAVGQPFEVAIALVPF